MQLALFWLVQCLQSRNIYICTLYMLELCTRHAPGAQIPGPARAPLPPVRGPGLQELLPHPPQPAAPRHPAPPGGVGGVQGIRYCGTVHNLFWCPRNVVLWCTGHQVLWCPLFSAPNTVVFRAPGTEAHLVLHSGPLLPHPDEGDPGGLLAGAEDRGDGGLQGRQCGSLGNQFTGTKSPGQR